MRMSVGVGPFRFYSGHSRKLPPPSPTFGRVMFFCAILIGVGDGIYALITRGFASAVATFFFMLVIGLVCLVKTAKQPGRR